MKCSRCGAQAKGNFCGECGEPVAAPTCRTCGAKVSRGARFCAQCGIAIGTSASEGRSASPHPGWWVATALLVLLIVVAALAMLRDGGGTSPPARPAPAAPEIGAVDPASMNPREVADQLFNRVMSSAEAGDSADVALFLSNAIMSYEMARPLDADGLFHLALLHRTAEDHQASLAAAREALDILPDHLLNLSAAAQAAAQLGDTQTAAAYYEHLLKVFDAELATERTEYRLHATLVSRLRTEAETFLQER